MRAGVLDQLDQQGNLMGLVVHSGPTINAAQVATLSWNADIKVVSRLHFPIYPDYTDPNDPKPNAGQVWYQIQQPPGWILARIVNFEPDATQQPGVVIRGTPPEFYYIEDGDPCGNEVTEPTGDLTFTYNRRAAAEYAILHSYDRNTVEKPDNRATRFLDNVDIPYAEFIYNIAGSAEGTFSAIFISESLWAGGMPMMLGVEENCDSTVQSDASWRYCSDVDTGSQPWNLHKALGVVFTTGNFPIPSYTIVSDLIADELKGMQVDFTDLPYASVDEDPSATTLYIEPSFDLENQLLVSLRDGGDETFDPVGLNIFARTHLAEVKMGDYMWIYPQGAFAHGLLVVGWAQPRTCSEVVSDRTNPQFGTSDFYVSAQDAASEVMIVPYVADLTTVHSPMPRPFYCTWYLQETNRPTFLSTDFDGFADHRMRFYIMPEQIIVGSGQGRLYVDPYWVWEREN